MVPQKRHVSSFRIWRGVLAQEVQGCLFLEYSQAVISSHTTPCLLWAQPGCGRNREVPPTRHQHRPSVAAGLPQDDDGPVEESGAGKTINTKSVIQYFATTAA
ncbi:uncharacterized protein LOC143508351 [Brachyhypopomus gauderio]|uniref:uncharacterized protein LOC143508351 n=1 Tax=Brachyhypopomus gauderio TaxID=698409 RepID=UPI004042ABC2